MLKRLFLSIIILSALASEGGAAYTADLIDYYLSNLTHLDMIQHSRDTISSSEVQQLNSLERKGTPVAFFKAISQDAIDFRVSNRESNLGLFWMSCFTVILAILIVSFICLKQISLVSRQAIFSLSDSSPPVYC